MVDAGWETIFGFLDTVADTYIYYILLSSIIIYCILLFIIYLILQTLQTADKMYKTTASGPSIRFMDHPLIKKTDFARAISAKLIPIKSLGLKISYRISALCAPIKAFGAQNPTLW